MIFEANQLQDGGLQLQGVKLRPVVKLNVKAERGICLPDPLDEMHC